MKNIRGKKLAKGDLFRNIYLTSHLHKKTGPSVETERPLRLLDMRLFKCIICSADNLLKNVLPACLFYSVANLYCKTSAYNSTYFLFYHARRGDNILQTFTSIRFPLNS